MSKGFLITGATGQQGGAVVKALLASGTSSDSFTILAVTRDPASPTAQKLQALSSTIKLVKGDLNDSPSLLSAAQALHPEITGVFSVQTFMGKGGPASEQAQGMALIDACIAAKVRHIVQTSVDRGGDVASFNTPTDVPHFASKHNIEHHLVDSTRGTATHYTILRPVGFMENFKPGFPGSVFGALLRDRIPSDRKLQFVSVKDIGWYGAAALLEPDKYLNKGISIAGDEVTFAQLNELFVRETGKPFPATYGLFGSLLAYMVHDLGRMFQWMADTGYQADVKACREAHPGMTTLKSWLVDESAFVTRD